MSIFRFVTQDELDDLPDDPQIAFATIVNHAQRRFSELIGTLDPDERYDWQKIEDARHSFMNIVVAAAKRFEIEPFVGMDVPTWSDFEDKHHRQFQADLDHYITQLVIDNSTRSKRESVSILPRSKDRIRSHLHGLRTCIENANMTDAKREALLRRLDDFERELEKRRLSLMAVTQMTFTLLAIPGAVWASGEVPGKLIANVMQIIAEAKAAEDETRQLPPVARPKALMPPRAQRTEPTGAGTFPSDLDDDVPF